MPCFLGANLGESVLMDNWAMRGGEQSHGEECHGRQQTRAEMWEDASHNSSMRHGPKQLLPHSCEASLPCPGMDMGMARPSPLFPLD